MPIPSADRGCERFQPRLTIESRSGLAGSATTSMPSRRPPLRRSTSQDRMAPSALQDQPQRGLRCPHARVQQWLTAALPALADLVEFLAQILKTPKASGASAVLAQLYTQPFTTLKNAMAQAMVSDQGGQSPYKGHCLIDIRTNRAGIRMIDRAHAPMNFDSCRE